MSRIGCGSETVRAVWSCPENPRLDVSFVSKVGRFEEVEIGGRDLEVCDPKGANMRPVEPQTRMQT